MKLPPTPDGNQPKHTFVELPNGGKSRTDLVGTIKLSHSLTLKDVLCVPEFQVNLLSISKLTQDLGCNVTFYLDCYLVQDLTTKKVIGRGRQSNGLYYLSNLPSVHQTNTSHIPNLWHQRLGHPSYSPLWVLSKTNPEISPFSHDFCDVCPLAKQTRLSFHASTISSAKPFELIHCDIWGPHKFFFI